MSATEQLDHLISQFPWSKDLAVSRELLNELETSLNAADACFEGFGLRTSLAEKLPRQITAVPTSLRYKGHRLVLVESLR